MSKMNTEKKIIALAYFHPYGWIAVVLIGMLIYAGYTLFFAWVSLPTRSGRWLVINVNGDILVVCFNIHTEANIAARQWYHITFVGME